MPCDGQGRGRNAVPVCKTKITSNHQKLEEVRKDAPLEPSEGAQPCRHLDFGLLASRTGTESILLPIGTRFVVRCYGSPR